MANKGTHMAAGAIAGLAAYGLMKWIKKEPLTVEGVLASAAGGAVIACVPDVLEPALNPNHRKIFHSVAALGGAGYATKKVVESPNFSPQEKSACVIALVSLASHHVLDSRTPKGLPLVGL